MKKNGEKLKKIIVQVLEKHPEGLTIVELSRILSSHRQTITKYVLVLEAQNVIYRRSVGSATLHYLVKHYPEFSGRLKK